VPSKKREDYLKKYHKEYRQREENDGYECHRKEKERARRRVAMFHVRRNYLLGFDIPEFVKEMSCYPSVVEEYQQRLTEPVEVEEKH
jgi:hypothetical protein